MDVEPYIEEFRHQFRVAAESGGEGSSDLAERLLAPLDAALRLMLLEVLGDAVQEITLEMAPGSVELRLRGREPGFVVTPVDTGLPSEPDALEPSWPSIDADREEGEITRINLRLPSSLKARVDGAADREGLSTNAWLVRAATSSLERSPSRHDRRAPKGAQHRTGWAR